MEKFVSKIQYKSASWSDAVATDANAVTSDHNMGRELMIVLVNYKLKLVQETKVKFQTDLITLT